MESRADEVATSSSFGPQFTNDVSLLKLVFCEPQKATAEEAAWWWNAGDDDICSEEPLVCWFSDASHIMLR